MIDIVEYMRYAMGVGHMEDTKEFLRDNDLVQVIFICMLVSSLF